MFLKRCGLLVFYVFAFMQSGIAAEFLSSYGVVRNVPNYSNMPGWNPNSPYNLKSPQVVYVMGPDLGSGDCQRAVTSVIESYCSGINNCQNIKFPDARPALMVTLSRLPGHSFATACAGYLEPAFDAYVSEHSTSFVSTTPVAFPGAKYNIQSDDTDTKKPKGWMAGYAERSAELENLQAQNGAGSEILYSADMPATFADLDFTTRQEILAAGYEPYKDAKAYQTITVESYDKYKERLQTSIQSFCSGPAQQQLKILNADLVEIQKCKNAGIPVNKCNLQGQY